MITQKNLRIIVIDDDESIRALLETALSAVGHHILTYPNPTSCQVYQSTDSQCSQDFPCADVVITDNMMPKMSGIEYLTLMSERGCKIQDANKALMSAGITSEQKDIVERLGCHFFRKPFKISEVTAWIQDCAQRVPSDRELAKLH